jgi:hypothetical protein
MDFSSKPLFLTIAQSALAIVTLAISTAAAQTPLAVEVEALRFSVDANQLQRPNTGGRARIAVTDFSGAAETSGRITLILGSEFWKKDSEFRLAYAPFRANGSAISTRDFRYDGVAFRAGEPTRATYQFDTYRLTYAIPLLSGPDWAVKAGGTFALRDAVTRFEQGNNRAAFNNRGLVPLLHLSAQYGLTPQWKLIADVDGALAPAGSLLDGSVRVAYAFTPTVSAYVGARHLVGGARGSDFYNFVRTTALSTGLRATF